MANRLTANTVAEVPAHSASQTRMNALMALAKAGLEG
jgi:hypothetical protein